jgi:cell division protein FtsB
MPSKINLTSKLTLGLLALLLIFLGRLKYQQYKNQQAIDREKQRLEQQISSLGKKNQDLSDSLSYLGSADFKERVARQQLNLKKDGEVVFGFSDNAAQAQSGALDSGQNAGPNYEKWIEYFFGNN